MPTAESFETGCAKGWVKKGPDLGVTLGCQWMTIRGITAKRNVKSMVAHCCDASMNLQFTERKVQAFAPLPIEFDL